MAYAWETSAGAVATGSGPLGVNLPDDAPLAPSFTRESLNAMQQNAIGEQLRKEAATAVRSHIYTDGKLRVAPKADAKFMAGHALFSFRAGDVIDDPFVIGLLDANGIAYDVLSAPEPAVAKVTRKGRNRGALDSSARRVPAAHGLPDDGQPAGH